MMGTYRILTLDGGGIRGLLTAVLLRRLEEKAPGWLTKVDLIAGTSTGGILALALARGLSPAELQKLYYEQCRVIFDDSWKDNLFDLGQIIGAQYSSRNLARVIEEFVGPVTLGELDKNVLISSFDLDNNARNRLERSWKPKFFQNFHGKGNDRARLARDVALYTSAAPSYFPAVDGYVDGGVVANNPSMAALAQVFDERVTIPNRPNLNEVRLLSVGTGKQLNYINSRRKKYLDWGFAQWAQPLLEIMLDGSMGLADYQCQQLLGKQQYRRTNPVLTKSIGLDACNKMDELIRIGERHNIDKIVDWLKTEWL